MAAKDRVMTDVEVKEELKKYDIPEVFIDEETCKRLTIQMGNIISVVRKAQDGISFKAGQEEEAKAIIRCIKDAKRVHPNWGMDDIIYLLEFREDARQASLKEKGMKLVT